MPERKPINGIAFVTHQIEHYSSRVSQAKSLEEKFWLRNQLYNLKQALITYYN